MIARAKSGDKAGAAQDTAIARIEHGSAPVDPRRSWQVVHPLPKVRPAHSTAGTDGLKAR